VKTMLCPSGDQAGWTLSMFAGWLAYRCGIGTVSVHYVDPVMRLFDSC